MDRRAWLDHPRLPGAAELVSRAQRGEADAFNALAHLVVDRCLAIAYRSLGDADLAMDAVQSALIAAWRDIGTLRDPDRFQPWFFRILLRQCYSEARRQRRQSAGIRSLSAEDDLAMGEIRAVDDRDELERGLRRLTADQREAVIFRHYHGMSVGQVAERMGIPIGTAKSRIHHATAALRASVDADGRTLAPHPGPIEP